MSYKEIWMDQKPSYIFAGYKGRDQSIIARFRTGMKQIENRY